MAFQGEVDIKMTYEGDIALEGGDLSLARGFDWLSRELHKILRTNKPDWNGHPQVGANLEDFAGEINNRETAAVIRNQILFAINRDDISSPGVFDVRVVPAGKDRIMIVIYLDNIGSKEVASKVVYDYRNGIVEDIQEPAADFREKERLPAGYKRPDNPYMNRRTL